MNGIINVIKPPGMSSHQLVSYVRRILRIKRIGHTGTLDPGAGGVLLLCVGKATRLVPFLADHDKTYIAEMTLGISTTSQDADGETVDLDTELNISPNKLGTAFSSFLGQINQIPPMASAVKVNGVRLYQLERQGVTIERKPRKVTIKELHINKIWPETQHSLAFGSRVLFYVRCSKGTYIRTLCHDLGRALGTYAHMSFLTRIGVGPFSIETSITLEELEAMADQGNFDFLLPMAKALPDFPQVKVAPFMERRVLNGNAIPPDYLVDVPKSLVVGDQVLITAVDGELLAIGEIRYKEQLICQPIRVLKEGR